ncbi:exported hypothetical protein [Vibrio jasicida]|uniref:Uncharacterized protein n=1 Tax=Vibrio jasicida TaxID=766224 RepID=A0AAU9QTT1_9VIBR|nr:hypothetical protein [Vibrio parahaemolyticus]CAH1598242.1 exported hypothetical protein [Vibrio jasicida]CAH1601892.1 exported hypothetical protein [Vibrio jasicida]
MIFRTTAICLVCLSASYAFGMDAHTQNILNEGITAKALAKEARLRCNSNIDHLVGDISLGVTMMMDEAEAASYVEKRRQDFKSFECDRLEPMLNYLNERNGYGDEPQQ